MDMTLTSNTIKNFQKYNNGTMGTPLAAVNNPQKYAWNYFEKEEVHSQRNKRTKT
ncbi:MAG: hypothetical protein IPF58_17420 [Saprospirales bacterium]|nr:hypothetical protein [Saprospirales bacterium]